MPWLAKPGLALAVGVSLVCSLALLAQAPPQEPPDVAPILTGKQQRELLRWNHRRIQRDIRQLAKLSDELQERARKHKSELLTPEQRAEIAQLQVSAETLREEFDKTDPFILALGIVERAESIRTQAKNLREYFEAANRDAHQFSKLQTLVREIEKYAERVGKRLRYP